MRLYFEPHKIGDDTVLGCLGGGSAGFESCMQIRHHIQCGGVLSLDLMQFV